MPFRLGPLRAINGTTFLIGTPVLRREFGALSMMAQCGKYSRPPYLRSAREVQWVTTELIEITAENDSRTGCLKKLSIGSVVGRWMKLSTKSVIA